MAAASLYAVAAPAELLGLNSVFWGMLLLALAICYTMALRAHETGNGVPIREADFLQVVSTVGVFAAGLLTGIIRLCAWGDERRKLGLND